MPLQGHCAQKCHTNYMQASPLWKPGNTQTHTNITLYQVSLDYVIIYDIIIYHIGVYYNTI